MSGWKFLQDPSRFLTPALEASWEGRVERPLGGWMPGYLLEWGETLMKAEGVKQKSWFQVDFGEKEGPQARWQVSLGPVTLWVRAPYHYGWKFRFPLPGGEGQRAWLQQDWEWYWYGPFGWHTVLTVRQEVRGWMGLEQEGKELGVEVGRGGYVRIRLVRVVVVTVAVVAAVVAIVKGVPWLLRLGGNPPVPEVPSVAP